MTVSKAMRVFPIVASVGPSTGPTGIALGMRVAGDLGGTSYRCPVGISAAGIGARSPARSD